MTANEGVLLCIPVGDVVVQLPFSEIDDIHGFILTEWADWYCEWLQNESQHLEPIQDDMLWVEDTEGYMVACVWYDPETAELQIN